MITTSEYPRKCRVHGTNPSRLELGRAFNVGACTPSWQMWACRWPRARIHSPPSLARPVDSDSGESHLPSRLVNCEGRAAL
eukprot:5388880-Pyramimonas_sp.AAC.1